MIDKTDIYGYCSSSKSQFIRISTSNFDTLNDIKRLVNNGLLTKNAVTFYETSLSPVVRFMVDTKIVGVNWIQLKGSCYRVRELSNKATHCQLECDIR